MSNEDPNVAPTFPCVVQVGFAGSRQLFDPPAPNAQMAEQWETQVQQQVETALQQLRKDLNLKDHHFLCGISQIACGADFVFTRACQAQKISNDFHQRIFLPQQVEDYLSAVNLHSVSDFTSAQQNEARHLLASDHVIQQHVVSLSPNRTERFKETNAEILRFSDVVICLLRDNAKSKSGGTEEFLDRAKKSGIPVLEIRILIKDRNPDCQNFWHNKGQSYRPPEIPKSVAQIPLPADVELFPRGKEDWGTLRKPFSEHARQKQKFFTKAAAWIIGTHIFATICATGALALHHNDDLSPKKDMNAAEISALVPRSGTHWDSDNPVAKEGFHKAEPVKDDLLKDKAVKDELAKAELTKAELVKDKPVKDDPYVTKLIVILLSAEILALIAGFGMHLRLHHSKAAWIWASSRLVAELLRSIQALHPRHVYLEHLFHLSLPDRFRAFLRTLNVQYLCSTHLYDSHSWTQHQVDYQTHRIRNQISTYYSLRLKKETFKKKIYEIIFYLSAGAAMLATIGKLLWKSELLQFSGVFAFLPSWLGPLAIILPMLGVAGLSWAAALDYEARVETFREAHDFLQTQEGIIGRADTAAEYDRLLLETETVLLGEVTNWFSRRRTKEV